MMVDCRWGRLRSQPLDKTFNESNELSAHFQTFVDEPLRKGRQIEEFGDFRANVEI